VKWRGLLPPYDVEPDDEPADDALELEPAARMYEVSFRTTTSSVRVFATDRESALDEAIESFEQLHEFDRHRDNLVVERVTP
jgi:hypothetical protein